MAVDEYLFARVREERHTFLRFYQWEKPTISLSYGQEAARVVDIDFCRANGIDIVRRMTGGKVVLHLRELTYSLASSNTETFTPSPLVSYRSISLALVKGLALMDLSARLASASPPPMYVRGTMPCFAFPAKDEIEIGGRKIIGSAQKRIGASFIQHGSVPLDKDALMPADRRAMVRDLGESYQISERRACAVMLMGRSTQRYRSITGGQEALTMRIREIAAVRVRSGYKRIHSSVTA